jgi:capsule polysaccharide export protein KpsE/RkpR
MQQPSVLPSSEFDPAVKPNAPEGLLALLTPLAPYWGRLVLLPLLAGALAAAGSFLVAPTFTATTILLPPQQQGGASGALASLNALAVLTGAGPRNSADLYVSLMQTSATADRIIDHFKLMEVYKVDKRWQARRDLADSVAMGVGKKDGLITISVEDEDPQRAANMANRYVEELKRMTSTLAVTEAQERRVFFESQLKLTKEKLTAAQSALQATGFTVNALKAEPKAAAEGYARLRAELTSAEVKLQAVRGGLTDTAPEVRQLQDTVVALRGQVAKNESARETSADGPDYVTKYREFKYQEVLFDLMARQYELARVDESREGALIQVVDVAKPPERKTRPKRSMYGVAASLGLFLALITFFSIRWRIRSMELGSEVSRSQWSAFKAALRS